MKRIQYFKEYPSRPYTICELQYIHYDAWFRFLHLESHPFINTRKLDDIFLDDEPEVICDEYICGEERRGTMPPKCKVCGKRTIQRLQENCLDCRKWFAGIKSALWSKDQLLWYKCRAKGLL